MITIIHGTDEVASRNFYFGEKENLKNFMSLDGNLLDFDTFFQNTQNLSMFDNDTTLLIENFLSKSKSNSPELKKIVDYVNQNKNLNVIFFESTELSKTLVLSFKNPQIKSFSTPKQIFTFLDNIKPNNSRYLIQLFHQLLNDSEVEIIFFMLIRQFRFLVSLQSNPQKNIDEFKRLAPWQISKFKRQLSFFDKERLLSLYNEIFEMELSYKTGKKPYSLEKSIDIFLSGL